MTIIADSGSTNTQWCLLQNDKIINEICTEGINPYYQTEVEIAEIVETRIATLFGKSADAVYFYGAGCAFSEKKRIVANAIRASYPQARIEIKSDLLAAARGLLGCESGIACILGTGSNSCVYNGREIIQNVSPLGYILGDEGSGAALGKKLIGDLLKNQLPQDLKNCFFEKYKLTPADILDSVYKKPFPNRFLAKFSPFILENIQEQKMQHLVRTSFEDFICRNVHQYDYRKYRVVFVGSIAYYFREILEEVAAELGISVAAIEISPMQGLIEYHLSEPRFW